MAIARRRPRLGQHYLASSTILSRIAREVGSCSIASDLVVEIGAGRGALTRRLLAAGLRVLAIEIDAGSCAALNRQFASSPGFELIQADVLQLGLPELVLARGGGPAVVTGNLPYYITSPILRLIFDAGERVSHAVVLMQREVARRTVARPGKRDFGYLSLLCQAHSRPELLFSVPPGAFRPPPKVTSALVRFSIEPQLARWGVADRQAFLEFAQLCFHHKRKTLRNNLEPRFGRQRLASLPQAGLRAEQLSPEQLASLWLLLTPD